MSRFRLSLPLKLLVSYLLIVGLLIGAGYIYIQHVLTGELDNIARAQLDEEAKDFVRRLSGVSQDELESEAGEIQRAFPARVTVIALDGTVISDSQLEASEMENHANREEVRGALRDGVGFARRHSSSMNDERIYLARPFPEDGPPVGIVRLSIAQAAVGGALDRGESLLQNAAAVALTVALLFCLLAAFVVTRPMRRVSHAASVFATGDFSHPIDVHSNDEVGDVAQALRDMAARLRGILVKSGAQHATFKALLDELPVGIVLFGKGDRLLEISAPTRMLLDLHPADQRTQIARLAQQDDVVDARAEARKHGKSETFCFELPWLPDRVFEGRWVNIFADDGTPRMALIIAEPRHERPSLRILAGPDGVKMPGTAPENDDGKPALGKSSERRYGVR